MRRATASTLLTALVLSVSITTTARAQAGPPDWMAILQLLPIPQPIQQALNLLRGGSAQVKLFQGQTRPVTKLDPDQMLSIGRIDFKAPDNGFVIIQADGMVNISHQTNIVDGAVLGFSDTEDMIAMYPGTLPERYKMLMGYNPPEGFQTAIIDNKLPAGLHWRSFSCTTMRQVTKGQTVTLFLSAQGFQDTSLNGGGSALPVVIQRPTLRAVWYKS